MKKLPKHIAEKTERMNEQINSKCPNGFKVKNNKLYKVTGKSENKTETLISVNIPVIEAKYTDYENTVYLLSFIDNGKKIEFNIKASDLTESRKLNQILSEAGFDIDEQTKNDILKFITGSMRVDPPPVKQLIQRLGHTNGKFINPLDKTNLIIVTDNGQQQVLEAYKRQGTINDYQEKVFNLIKDNSMAMCMLYGSLGSILCNPFKVDTFIIDLSGETSTGKTTILKIAASAWGTNELIQKWNTTPVALERVLIFLNSLPAFYDDTKELDDKHKNKIAYHVANSKNKPRGNLTGFEETLSYNLILLSTGEEALKDMAGNNGGAKARIISLEDDEIFSSSFDFSTLYKGIEENHGLLGSLFWKQYISDETKYINLFQENLNIYEQKASDNKVLKRLGRNLALLKTTGQILNDIEGFEHDPAMIIEHIYQSMIDNGVGEDTPTVAFRDFIAHLKRFETRIINCDVGFHIKENVIGVLTDELIIVNDDYFKEYCKQEKLERNAILKQWRKRDFVKLDKDRYRYRKKINGKQYNGIGIKLDYAEKIGSHEFSYKSELEKEEETKKNNQDLCNKAIAESEKIKKENPTFKI